MKKLRHVPVSNTGLYTAGYIRTMTEPEIICFHGVPIAALVPYALFLEWQERLKMAERLGLEPKTVLPAPV